MGGRCTLANFVRSQLTSRATLACSASLDDLFPCPVPSRLVCRATPEDRCASIARDVLRAVVATLNFCALGFHGHEKGVASLGIPPSCDQSAMLDRLEEWVTMHVTAPAQEPSSLGRALDKLLHLSRSIDTIRGVLAELSADGRYCKLPQLPKSDVNCAARPLCASRVKWPLGATFDPLPYLDYPELVQAYVNPESLLAPPEDWPCVDSPAHVHASRAELLTLLAKWDEVGVLRVVPADTVDKMVRLGLFTVFKDSDFDRLILNPSVRNGRSQRLAEYTRYLPAGYLLCALHLEPSEVLRVSSDDLREYYYTFRVSEERARANAIGCEFLGSELGHLRACPASLAHVRVLPCLATLAMGDALAPEVAQCAHWRLIELRCGGMRPEHLVGNRMLIPRGPMYECLTYDDHCTLYRLPAARSQQCPRPDLDLHSRCDSVYPQVGLHPHPGKCVRDASSALVLGAHVDGSRGCILAPPLRTLVLMRVTMEMVRLGCVDLDTLAVLVGCWVHVCMYRRPLLCLLHDTYLLLASRPNLESSTVRLRDHVKCELLALALLSVLAVSDLRSPYCPWLFGTDASPYAAGVVRAEVGVHAAAELWRVGELRGYHAKLLPARSEMLHASGMLDPLLESLVEDDAC
eukprot:6492119-Amphidinium_carterae.1